MTLGWLLDGKKQKKTKSNVNISDSRCEKIQRKEIERLTFKT